MPRQRQADCGRPERVHQAVKYRVVRIFPEGHAVVLSRHKQIQQALARSYKELQKMQGIVHVETPEGLNWSGIPW